MIGLWDDGVLDIGRYSLQPTLADQSAITPEWSTTVDSSGGLASPVALDDRSLCAVAWDDDAGRGSLVAVAVSGEERWRVHSERAVKSTPVVSGDRLIAVDVAAGVLAIDSRDGSVSWRAEPVSPLRTWCWTSPVVVDDLVVVSTPTRVVAYRLADGEIAWERGGLVPHANLLSHCTPVVAGDTLVVGFWPFTPAYFGIDVSTGEVRWAVDDPEGSSIEGATGRGTALGPWSPVGPGVIANDVAIFPSSAGWAAIDVTRGAFLWRSPDDGRFRPGKPALVGGDVIVTSPDGVRRLSAADGSVGWSVSFPVGLGVALAPYRVTPHVGTAGAIVVETTVIVPGLDGCLHRLDSENGTDLGELEIGVRSAAAPLDIRGSLVVASLDGSLTALARGAVIA